MRIAIVYPDTPLWPKYRWVHHALRNMGHEAWQVRTRQGLVQADATADLVILPQKNIAIRWPNLRDIAAHKQATWVLWWFDLIKTGPGPLADQSYIKSSLSVMQACDLVFVKERPLLEEYRSLGIPAEYLDQGAPTHWHPVDAIPEWDIVVWGQGGPTYSERSKAVGELVKAGYAVAWAGHGFRGTKHLPWTNPEKFPEMTAKGRVLLHVSRCNDIEGYTSDGFWMACATGRPVVKKAYPGMPSGPYQVFRDSHDLVDAVKRAMEQDGREIREWVMAHHTIEHRCRDMLAMVERARTATALAS